MIWASQPARKYSILQVQSYIINKRKIRKQYVDSLAVHKLNCRSGNPDAGAYFFVFFQIHLL